MRSAAPLTATAQGLQRQDRSLLSSLAASCGLNTSCPGGVPSSSLLGVSGRGPVSRIRKSPSGLHVVNPVKDGKTEGILSKGRGEARGARSSLRHPRANVLGFFSFI